MMTPGAASLHAGIENAGRKAVPERLTILAPAVASGLPRPARKGRNGSRDVFEFSLFA
ncbi:hypothetical protein LMG23992_00196 [Cupriavidus laharis]|uniref:Uncharacterized protein n=1 Tax=Cupriavidus laharis TaxID=151654 RepID=A0ABN7XZE3_9BURK|nr:hypothetical protein [Cupriavidus laharis]CAG9165050.1 hypothetical protein LMG23992_00196 [Cupriavidus laharis]